MDRDELEERIRGRRPGEGFRRGSAPDEAFPEEGSRSGGYVPFQPEPEDALAAREAAEQPTRRVDRFGDEPSRPARDSEPESRAAPPPPVVPPPDEPRYDEPRYQEPYAEPQPEPRQAAYDEQPYFDDEPYGAPEDAYAYPYPDDRRDGGSSALPIIGFAALCVLALAVGAVLAGLFTGEDQVGIPSPTPTAQATQEATPAPSVEATPAPSGSAAPATPEPTDGPVAFPDGARYELHVCGTDEYTPSLDGCVVDGSTNDGDAWVLVVFEDGVGSDQLELELRSGGDPVLPQPERKLLGDVVSCGQTCDGLIYGLVLRGLDPGDYEVTMRRDGSFADRATFTVAG
jgi:hypothetical protein